MTLHHNICDSTTVVQSQTETQPTPRSQDNEHSFS